MAAISAGLLMYRWREGELEVLLVHPGGPLFRNKDAGAWTVPKGLVEAGEELLAAAEREFEEETQLKPRGPFLALTPIKQKGGKLVHVWAFQGDCDPAAIVSNQFRMQWPPRSGKWQEFPEIDRAEFFDAESARRKINAAQAALIDQLQTLLQPPNDQ
jgi:predicted NUDIX family NTP pyrophosphohydrolase